MWPANACGRCTASTIRAAEGIGRGLALARANALYVLWVSKATVQAAPTKRRSPSHCWLKKPWP